MKEELTMADYNARAAKKTDPIEQVAWSMSRTEACTREVNKWHKRSINHSKKAGSIRGEATVGMTRDEIADFDKRVIAALLRQVEPVIDDRWKINIQKYTPPTIKGRES